MQKRVRYSAVSGSGSGNGGGSGSVVPSTAAACNRHHAPETAAALGESAP